jgi:parallel beta-helix repeat protein
MKTTMRRWGLCLAASLLAGGLAPAADLQVAATGSDGAGDGSAARPYREIRKALERIQPGDTIMVAAGQYQGFTLRDLKGTAAKAITIKAAGPKVEILPTTDRSDNRDTLYLDGCSYIVIDGFRSFRANRAGIRLEGSDHITVRNCVFGNSGCWGIFTGHCDDLLIENNECYGSVKEHGIYVGNSGDRPVIRGNRSHDNSGCGIHMNADLGCGGDGIISGARVEDNIIYGNGRKGGSGINMDGVQESLIRNNLLYDNHATGICGFRINGAAGPKGLKIINNTVIMAKDARYALQFGQTAGPCIVRNNILYSLNPVRGGLAYGVTADAAAVDSDGNLFAKEVPVIALNDWQTRLSLGQWQAKGYERHSGVGTAADLFVAPAANDYRLAPNSPAIGKGLPLDKIIPGVPAGQPLNIGCQLPAAPR